MEDLTDDLTIARHISEIIVSCCLVEPFRNPTELYDIALQYAIFKLSILTGRRRTCITGSCAEFYIHPAVTCVGDTDLMFSKEGHIAVFDDSTVESEVGVNEPTEVWLLETSGCPKGYGRLRKICQTYFNWVTGQIEYFTSNDRSTYLCIGSEYVGKQRNDPLRRKGPAFVFPFRLTNIATLDQVPYIHLLGWPPVTKSWPTRDRSYAWPCHALISEVLLNGCDLVCVSHRIINTMIYNGDIPSPELK